MKSYSIVLVLQLQGLELSDGECSESIPVRVSIVSPAATVMENSTGGFEVQIDNFLEHFKRTSKAMEQANEGCPLVVPPVPPRRRPSSNTQSSSRPTSLAKADGFDCLEDLNSEGRYCDIQLVYLLIDCG